MALAEGLGNVAFCRCRSRTAVSEASKLAQHALNALHAYFSASRSGESNIGKGEIFFANLLLNVSSAKLNLQN